MRLINADELKEKLSQQWFIDILLTKTSSNDMSSALADMIDSQLTAYEVDRVVEQLEAEKGTYFDGLPCEGTKITVNAAIEIVKAGGIDER